MRTNTKVKALTEKTHEGAPAYGNLKPIQMLRRSVMSCFLFEDEAYEDGKKIADRIMELSQQVSVRELADLAVEARTSYKLRHVPLLLLCALVKCGKGSSIVSDTIAKTVNRPDEMGELVSLYWKMQGKQKSPLAQQLKKGLAKAFCKFNEYSLAKYDRDVAVKIRDVMFLCHPKPTSDDQAAMFKRVADRTLVTPDTWEVELSAGKNKKETFTRLLQENKLGYFALLRNLRNMQQAGVDVELVRSRLIGVESAPGKQNILPFRYIAAARAVPSWEPVIDAALCDAIKYSAPLDGNTVVLVDVSGSMNSPLSSKSDLQRIDAAAALGSIIKAQGLRVFTFSDNLVEVPPRRGMAGVDAIIKSQRHNCTNLGDALDKINATVSYDRIIVITDEQSHDKVNGPRRGSKGYMINVASNRVGVGYGSWVHIDGFSERVIDYIVELERH